MNAIERLLRDSLPYLKRPDRRIDRVLNCSSQLGSKRASACSLFDFYRAMLCIRGTSRRPVSVRLSQVGVLLKHRITQTTPHDSAGTLVF